MAEICVIHDCNKIAQVGVFCPDHLPEEMAGITEPEAEARARAAAQREEALHRGERKVYHDDGTSEWVPISAEESAKKAWHQQEFEFSADRIPTSGSNLATGSVPWLEPSDGSDYLMDCLEGRKGTMAKMVAEAMVEGMSEALRKL